MILFIKHFKNIFYLAALACLFTIPFSYTMDSDPNRRHNVGTQRNWRWTRTFNCTIRKQPVLKIGGGEIFSMDFAHLQLAEIERQFSFAVEQKRDELKKNILAQKMQIANLKTQFQMEMLQINREEASIKEEALKLSENFKQLFEILKEVPTIRGKSETDSAFKARKVKWFNKELGRLHQICGVLDISSESLNPGLEEKQKISFVDKCISTKEDVESRQRALEHRLKEFHAPILFEKNQQEISAIEKNVRGLEARLQYISTSINVAVVGISLILQKDPSAPPECIFMPLMLQKEPIVFSSCPMDDIDGFAIIDPPRSDDFGSRIAIILEVNKSPYAGIMPSYRTLRDTETNAIDYLLSKPREAGYKSILHQNITGMLKAIGYNLEHIKAMFINIHTKKDPCSLCTRIMEGLGQHLRIPAFIKQYIPGLNTVYPMAVLVSSCEEYRIGEARKLFLENDIARDGDGGFDLLLKYPEVLFQVLY
jgi:predicted  nucleic acid-binding Zn-ribbon protein